MPSDDVNVTYKVLANFLALKKAVATARKDIDSLRREEIKFNKDSVAGSKRNAAAHRDATRALRSRTTSTKTATRAILAHNEALKENRRLNKLSGSASEIATEKLKEASSTVRKATRDYDALTKKNKEVAAGHKSTAKAAREAADGLTIVRNTMKRTEGDTRTFWKRVRDTNVELNKARKNTDRAASGFTAIGNAMRRVNNIRFHWMPPMIALIPIVAGLLALMNPLVSIMGAIGAAGFGAGAGLLSLGGAAIAIVPMLTAAVGAITSLLVAFKGIGGVFSKYKAATKLGAGGGGGGGGTSAADQAWATMKANERLTNAQEDALEAQDNLNDARKEAVRRLRDLRAEVNQNVLDEADAAANLQKATEEYYNTLADPGSTLGDKMQATADLADAQQAVSDAQQKSADDAADLADAQAKGVEGDKQVVAAQKQLRNSLREVRDAQHDLNKEVAGGGGGGGGVSAMDQFNDALNKLSPSARKVVLGLIAMGDAWHKVHLAVQEAFFSNVVNDLDDLEGMLPTIQNLLSKSADAMGRLTHNFIMLVTSPKWKGDLNIISDQNVKLIDLAGASVLNILNAVKDITIAAGPFAIKLLGSFERLTKSFSNIVSNARETGSLARWLDIVYTRLQQWWRIVKNIAQTLFNYGAASADFGKWITDGIEALTDGWLKSSKEARKTNSPFKIWLQEIKPLLLSMRALFSSFFHWLGNTAMDNDAITEAVKIIDNITDKLGPALSGIFKTLNSSGIGEAFVNTLSSIIDTINVLLQNGGAEGFKAFFGWVETVFRKINDIVRDPFWGGMFKPIIEFLGVLAAVSFVGKFTPLFLLFGWLLKLAKFAGVGKLLTGLAGLAGLGGIMGGGAGGAAAGGAAAGGAAAGGALAALTPLIIAALSAAFTQVLAKDASESAAKNINKNSKTDITSGAQIQASQGSGGGGMLLPGDGILSLDSPKKTKETKKAIDDLASAYRVFADAVDHAREKEQARTTFQQSVVDAMQAVQDAIQARKDAVLGAQAAEEGAFAAMNAAIAENGKHWDDGTLAAEKNKLALFQYRDAGVATAEAMRQNGSSYDEYKAKLEETRAKLSETLQGFGMNKDAADKLAGGIVSIPTFKQFTLQNNFDAAAAQANSFIAQLNRIPGQKDVFINQVIKETGARRGQVGAAYGAIGGIVGRMGQYLASGGGVRKLGSRNTMDPKGTDTEPAMLTPGEYVVQKKRVDEVGPENMQLFNDGMLSFAALLGKSKKSKNSGVGYFDGGGLAGKTLNTSAITSSARASAMHQTLVDNSMHFGDINIYNPKREAASESLPSALRRVSQRGGRRKPAPRLEGAVK